ncbi:MAG: flavodoxin family protein [Candidatus Peribacteraceae bacterium]|nr:flavodoxin family protein [Candidatus Peribacteraceae bacterium]
MSPAAHLIYASSSGHTEYVVDVLRGVLTSVAFTVQRAEEAQASDLQKGDVLVLACGTWNTGGSEGQLNMHMDALLRGRAKDIDLGGKPCAIIALGDDRYRYTCRATEHLMQFILKHNGTTCATPLLIVNEPYGQEEKVRKWGEKFLSVIAKVA